MKCDCFKITQEMSDELEAYFESLLVKSDVFIKLSSEAAYKFALEKRVPLEEEYFELMRNITDEVMEKDDEVNEKMKQKLMSLVLKDNKQIMTLFTQFAKELTVELRKARKDQSESELH